MDRVRIEEVFATLLANAFKHGAGHPVDVQVREQGDRVQIVVADHGGGIAADDLPEVFARGPRTALGLWIAKEIIVAHRGTIDLTSSPGQGSRFTIAVPRLAA
jgi:signal transduction histidine kinase